MNHNKTKLFMAFRADLTQRTLEIFRHNCTFWRNFYTCLHLNQLIHGTSNNYSTMQIHVWKLCSKMERH